MLLADEIQRVFECLPDTFRLIGEVLYATGLRVEELLGARVRDLESDGWCFVVRDSKGESLRRLRLPQRIRDALADHLVKLKRWHTKEVDRGGSEADLSQCTAAESLPSGCRWGWQFIFPSIHKMMNSESGRLVHMPLDAATVQLAFAAAGRAAGLINTVHAQSLRHAFAAEYLTRGRPIEDLQFLLGHSSPVITLRYVEVLRAAKGRSNEASVCVPSHEHNRQPNQKVDTAMAALAFA